MGNMKVLVHTAHVEKRQCEVFDAHFIKDGLHTGLGDHTLSMPAISGLFYPFPHVLKIMSVLKMRVISLGTFGRPPPPRAGVLT